MNRRTFLTRSLVLLTVGTLGAGLAGCGFRLRGLDRQALGIDSLTLVAAETPLADDVRRALAKAGVALGEDAPLRVNLGAEQIRETSLRGGDMIHDEVELRLTAPFSVQRASDNAYLLDQQRLDTATTYLVNNDNPLVRDEQRDVALADLRRQAAQQLLDRLRAL